MSFSEEVLEKISGEAFKQHVTCKRFGSESIDEFG
jgi:hypothetical protein